MQASHSTFQHTLDQLYARAAGGVKPGLEVISRLLAMLGDPQSRFPVIHVAGTNGKGSVCALLESMLRAHGLRTGLFTSPHLVRFNERFKVNGQDIPDHDLAALIQRVDQADKDGRGDERESSFFEFSTALAFEWFAQNEVQVGIIETGLGGRWDATNVVQPTVCAITRIAMDHERFLGDTLRAVAGEKAGIIKEGVPVVSSAQEAEVLSLLMEVAKERNARLVASDRQVTIEHGSKHVDQVKVESHEASYGSLKRPFAGPHQLENLAVAVATLEVFLAAFGGEADPSFVRQGLEGAQWPGRFQKIGDHPTFYIDGAHNPSAASALRAALTESWGHQQGAFVMAGMRDKDMGQTLSILCPLMAELWAVSIDSPRGLDPEALQAEARAHGVAGKVATLSEAVTAAQAWAVQHNSYVCLTGSLHLLGDFLKEDTHGFSSTGLVDYI